MSDNSFGDHSARNSCKNPLLSNAVTGLLLEDLTHKAILLPAAPSQAPITRPVQSASQLATLSDTDNAVHQSGDKNCNIYPPSITNITPSGDLAKSLHKHEYPMPFGSSDTVSKASSKSQTHDDFDVNEYFARLHGTRYVSAPLHSHLKDDNTNALQHTEEQLEEINLNEPDKSLEIQSSITADIAQNFSQLPNVLPHMASAVFSSFSNMLSYKSKEHTPEDTRTEHRDVNRNEAVGVPLVTVDDVAKEVAPPPKEPPVIGPGSYRITTKKKVYAQIPGLASGEAQALPTDPVLNQSINYFTPEPSNDQNQNTYASNTNIDNLNFRTYVDENINNRVDAQLSETKHDLYEITKNNSSQIFEESKLSQTLTSQQIIPPPPTFQNLKSDNQMPKAVLPPSVARRITGNHPLVKSQSTIVPSIPQNIFIPAPIEYPEKMDNSTLLFTPTATQEHDQITESVPMLSSNVNVESSMKLPSPFDMNESKSSMLTGEVSRDTSSSSPIIFSPETSTALFAKKDETEISFETNKPVADHTFHNVDSSPAQNIPYPTNISIPPLVPKMEATRIESTESIVNPLDSAKNPLILPPNPMIASKTPVPPITGQSFQPVPYAPRRKPKPTNNDRQHYLPPNISIFNPMASDCVEESTSKPTFITPENVPFSQSTACSGPIFPYQDPFYAGSDISTSTNTSLPSVQTFERKDTKIFPPVLEDASKMICTEIHPDVINANVPATSCIRPPEPPKGPASNFRMIKKRPQYYSGPIEGIGSISNNVKPVIPVMEPSKFAGSLFNPQDGVHVNTQQGQPSDIKDFFSPHAPSQDYSNPGSSSANIGPYVPPEAFTPNSDHAHKLYAPEVFDLNQINETQISQFDNSQQISTVVGYEPTGHYTETQPKSYNTSFDLSRPTTESYEEKENRGMGLLGSLKSRLSSIDINKIQNTVTTFFDPTFNEPKNQEQQQPDYYPNIQNTQGNFEIFVPTTHQYVDQSFSNYCQSDPHSQYQSTYPVTNYYTDSYTTSQNYPITTNVENFDGTSYIKPCSEMFQPETASLPIDVYTQPASFNLISNTDNIHQESISIQESSHALNFETSVKHPTQTSENIPPETTKLSVSQLPMSTTSSNDEKESGVTPTNLIPMFYSLPIQGNESHKTNTNVEVACLLPTLHENISADSKEKVESNDAAVTTPHEHDHASHEPEKVSISYTENIQITSNEKLSDDIKEDKYPRTNLDMWQYEPKVTSNLSSHSFFDSHSTSEVSDLQSSDTTNTYSLFGSYKNPVLSEITKPIIEDSWKSNTDKRQKNIASTDIPSTLPHVELFSGSDERPCVKDKNSCLIESVIKGDIPIVSISTAPLFGLSTVPTETIKVIDLENDMQKMNLIEATSDGFVTKNDITLAEKFDPDINISSEIISKFKNDTPEKYLLSQEYVPKDHDNKSFQNLTEVQEEVVLDPSISHKESNRELESGDVTSQLIENIISPIQLQNTVEVPLLDMNKTDDIQVDDVELDEITQIAEETFETLQVQSATDLLQDNMKTDNYGWRLDDNLNLLDNSGPDNVVYSSDHVFKQHQTLQSEHDYSFKIDPNALGFYGSDSLFFDNSKNATDDINILPSHMSVPSAPPEEDIKSEGLDVHSIEQDAKKDFPIYEEYVIEPENESSEGNDGTRDTFTDRIERFKQMEEHFEDDNGTEQHLQQNPVAMASYFDTGNYAVDSYYKNITPMISIPPGFEEKHRRKMSLGPTYVIPSFPELFIPDTSTQTKPTITTTYAECSRDLEYKVVSNITKLLDDGSPKTITPLISSRECFTKSSDIGEIKPEVDCFNLKELTSTAEVDLLKTTEGHNVVQNLTKVNDGDLLKNTSSEGDKVSPSLPDPSSFFNAEPTNVTRSQDENEPENSFSRLASYFDLPLAQTERSKPFFELSQSQNHYRHVSKTDPVEIKTDKQNSNIPDVMCGAYFDLIKDLTSPRNITEPATTIVRTVNYFTIEYEVDNKSDPKSLINKLNTNIKNLENAKNDNGYNKSKSEITDKNENLNKNNVTNTKVSNKNNDNTTIDNNDDSMIEIKNCKFCCNFLYNKFIFDACDIKIKRAMNESSEKEKSVAMLKADSSSRQKDTVTLDFESELDGESSDNLAVRSESRTTSEYTPVEFHWFYRIDVEDKSIWRGFSVQDSKALEEAFLSPDLNEETLVATDGGRYDVNVLGRLRTPVYWYDKPTNVRRCSWFYKGTTDARYVPYTESVAERLEMEYKHGITTGEWHRRLVLPNSELVVMHGPTVMVHFLHTGSNDGFTAPPQSMSRPRVVRRGHDESEIEEVEPSKIDHLLLLCHGVGSACDMRFRAVEEVVDDFRSTSMQLIQSHYNSSYCNGLIHCVEVLPISWHSTLHSGETGVDRRLAQITLDSIPRLRNFTNDTVLDVLFYTSPVYCQTIIDTVCKELNRIYALFRARNPQFRGGVSLGGHSLGSVILYDLLCHQMGEADKDAASLKSYVQGSTGTSQPFVNYPQLGFEPDALYALGSPIAIFECIRGVEALGMEFALPTCKNFFNIFHPYDPIAYRIEPLINSELKSVKPFLIPHHKGRKRMHLELKDTMARVGADLKQKLVESLRTTWNMWRSSATPTDGQLEKVVEEEIEKDQLCEDERENITATPEMLGRLNAGRRVDYVLQEAPLEMINEYLFAMTSHVGYWESEDTMLMMLREIYDSMGVQPDSTVPQQSLSVQRTRILGDETDSQSDPCTSRGAS